MNDSNYSEEATIKRSALTDSLHERNYFSVGTQSRQHLTEVVDQTIEACSDAMVLDIHHEYFSSPIMAKRIHTGFREELNAEQIHELAVLTPQISIAENKHLSNHVIALHTYSKLGLAPSENYALENDLIKAQCSALLTASYGLHGHATNQYLVWDADALSKDHQPCPRIKDKELIAYLLENPENALLLIKTIQERGQSFSPELMQGITGSVRSISEGTL